MEKSLSKEEVRDFVIAGHSNLEKIQKMLTANPGLLNVAYDWGEQGGLETAVQAAAHVGNRVNAEFLLGKGAPLEICTAAMLNRHEDVIGRIRAHPPAAKATGAHGIPLLAHAAFSRNPSLVQFVFKSGGTTGASLALQNAVETGNSEIVQWLLDNAGAGINAKNFEGKTPLRMARDRKDQLLVKLLTERGASD